MRIQRNEEGGLTIVQVTGVIKLGESARRFSGYLEELLSEGVPSVLIDLSGIDHVDSTGLGELVGYLQRFTSEGRRLALLNPHKRIFGLLKLTKLDEVFTIYGDQARAVDELGGS